jgi:localization factor PodJL
METARAGDPYAQFLIAGMYEVGDGLPKDLPESKRWYQKSAEKDFKQSQTKLGEFYAKGIGMEQPDLIEAYTWYSLAKPPFGQDETINAALKSK